MSILLSKPLSLSIVASSFGQGADIGGLQGDVWTPGRDANGVVNQISWANVPREQWMRIAGTEMSTLTDPIVAANLNWNEKSLSWSSYTQSWSGWGVDVVGSRVWTFSGGHSDGNNNGLYRFDALTMRWAIEQMPTDRLLQQAEYGALSGTKNPLAASDALAKFNAGTLTKVNDSWYDQFLVNNQPTSRHSYGSLVYDPTRDRIYMPSRRWWEFNRAAGIWDYRRLFNDYVVTLSNNWVGLTEYMDFEGIMSTWDEVTGEVLFQSSGSGGSNRSLAYRPSDATWRTWDAPWRLWGNGADARHGRTWTYISPPASTGPSVGKYWRYDLDSRSTVASGDLQYIGTSRADFITGDNFYDGPGACWVPSVGKYLFCTRQASGAMGFYWLDPAATPWSISPAAMNNAPSNLSRLLNRRMVYFDALNAILMQDLASTSLYLFKL